MLRHQQNPQPTVMVSSNVLSWSLVFIFSSNAQPARETRQIAMVTPQVCDAAEIFKGSRHVTHSEQWGHGPSTEPNLGLPTNTQ